MKNHPGVILCLGLWLNAMAGSPMLAQQFLSIEQLLSFKYPSGEITCSANGKQLAFVVNTANFENSHFQRQIWTTPVSPLAAMQPLLQLSDDCSAPQWSPLPESPWLTFLATPVANTDTVIVSRPTQIYLLTQPGVTPQQITHSLYGVESYCWSPVGNVLAYLSLESATELSRAALRARQTKRLDAQVYEQPIYRKEIWLHDFNAQIDEKIYAGDAGIQNLAFSPDGELLVFITNYTGQYDAPDYDLWLLSLGTRQTIAVVRSPGPKYQPQFSPDGRQITFLAHADPKLTISQIDLFLVSIDGGAPQNLTSHFDQNLVAYEWDARGEKIYLEAQARRHQFIYELDLKKQPIKSIMDLSSGGFFHSLHYAKATRQLFFLGENAQSLPEIYCLDPKNKISKITDNSNELRNYTLSKPEPFHWRDASGAEVEGFLMRPVNPQLKPPYPLVVLLHGGPWSRFTDRLLDPDFPQLFAHQGYLVFTPNPVGSSGYGEAFAQAIRQDLGGADFRQIMAGVDALIRQQLVDSTRMAIVGGSYGGYLVNWIISQTPRFKAAVSLYGIFNFVTDWGCSLQSNWEKIYFGGYYWENPDLYQARSPASFVEQIRTPLLLLHGELDQMTQLCNSKEAYRALKTLGKTVELVIYPREYHGIHAEPNHIIDKLQRIFNWLDQYLK
ncbi:S9 family peptidase [candidate division KSB1 bacterium]|nr:S9 family peptidase [candidate division KSB1 bacterium]